MWLFVRQHRLVGGPAALCCRQEDTMSETQSIHLSTDARIGFFDRLAQNWDDSVQDPDETVKVVEQRATLLDLRAGDCLLEVGCGIRAVDRLAGPTAFGRD